VNQISSTIQYAKVFVQIFLSVNASPSHCIIAHDELSTKRTITMLEGGKSRLLTCQLNCSRLNDEGQPVTELMGSGTLDLAHCQICNRLQGVSKTYQIKMWDKLNQKKQRLMGEVNIEFTELDFTEGALVAESPFVLQTHPVQTIETTLGNAAEANLNFIQPFGKSGLPGIKPGLQRVHSPYYMNHLGITLPSGVFCMIPTTIETNLALRSAIRSHKERLQVTLARNLLTEEKFIHSVHEMFKSGFENKYNNLLTIVGETLTLHPRLMINYTPDVQLTKIGQKDEGEEEWSVPRWPEEHGKKLSFKGDCEDYAREVLQQVKEIMEWVSPKTGGNIMEALSALLHLYVPTVEQGAVDSSAHSIYQNKPAAFRNHIYAGLHPRNHFTTKIKGKLSLQHLYSRWPQQKWENKLPLLHLEGTAAVVFDIESEQLTLLKNDQNYQIQMRYPELLGSNYPSNELNLNHKSSFYKYPIAFMTHVFAEQGILDFTYTDGQTYGVSIWDYFRSNYTFIPSTQHSPEVMTSIKSMLKMERPIPPITYRSEIIKAPTKTNQPFISFNKTGTFSSNLLRKCNHGQYQIRDKKIEEVYFQIG